MKKEIATSKQPSIPMAIVTFLSGMIYGFEYPTLVILVLLDLLFSSFEGVFSVIGAFLGVGSAGATVLPSIFLLAEFDIGLVILAFFIVLLMEGVIYKKSSKSLPLAIFAGLMMFPPTPILTIVVLAARVGPTLFEPKPEPRRISSKVK